MHATNHKSPFVPSVGVIGLLCNALYRQRPSEFCETSAKVPTDPFRSLWLEGGNFDVSTNSNSLSPGVGSDTLYSMTTSDTSHTVDV